MFTLSECMYLHSTAKKYFLKIKMLTIMYIRVMYTLCIENNPTTRCSFQRTIFSKERTMLHMDFMHTESQKNIL